METSKDQAGGLRVQQRHRRRFRHDLSVRPGLSAVYEPRKDVTPKVLLQQRNMVNGLCHVRGAYAVFQTRLLINALLHRRRMSQTVEYNVHLRK